MSLRIKKTAYVFICTTERDLPTRTRKILLESQQFTDIHLLPQKQALHSRCVISDEDIEHNRDPHMLKHRHNQMFVTHLNRHRDYTLRAERDKIEYMIVPKRGFLSLKSRVEELETLLDQHKRGIYR